MKITNKIISLLVVLTIIVSSGTITAFANEMNSLNDEVLNDNFLSGDDQDDLFAEQTKESNTSTDNATVTTSILEVDNLTEIENFLKCTNEELVGMGGDLESIVNTRKELIASTKKSVEQISQEKDVSLTEAKYYKKAIEKGLSDVTNETYKKTNNLVTASGSISTSKLKYEQKLTPKSTKLPNYQVKLSFIWDSPFTLIRFTDEVVVAWGGGLNTKNETYLVNYYNCGSKWTTKYKTNKMSKKTTPNVGIEFSFPQAVATPQTITNNTHALAKSGEIEFVLYQTKKEGKDTKIVSRYCHRVISVGSASIGISASGPNVSISIGGAWDTSPEKDNIIKY